MRLAEEQGKGDKGRCSVCLVGLTHAQERTHSHTTRREQSERRACGVRGRLAGVYERVLEWGGPGFRIAWAPPSSEPASPSAERSGCTDLLSGVRYLHMTCPFVNLAPQLLASLHLCLPVPRTLPEPASLSATSAACRAPPLVLALIAPTHLPPPRATLVWVAASRFSFPPVLLVLFLWLLLLLSSFHPVGNPGSRRLLRGAPPERAGLTASAPFRQDSQEHENSSTFCLAVLHCI